MKCKVCGGPSTVTHVMIDDREYFCDEHDTWGPTDYLTKCAMPGEEEAATFQRLLDEEEEANDFRSITQA